MLRPDDMEVVRLKTPWRDGAMAGALAKLAWASTGG
jgi:hypothetical protein